MCLRDADNYTSQQQYGFRANKSTELAIFNALKEIKSYLSNRRQVVCITENNQKYFSRVEDCLKGVPQGSILGPLLFLLYVNSFTSDFNMGYVCQTRHKVSV